MGFNVGLSGLRGAQMDLSVTGNNIANASTVGFKESRAEFGDVYASSILGTGRFSTGSGVLVERVSQQFAQGNIDYTDRALDLAINGNGFFIISDQGQIEYTRAGYFDLDKDGYIVNNTGKRLQGYEADLQGNIQSGAMGDIRLTQSNVEPRATRDIEMELNLDSRQTIPDNAFNPRDSATYNYANSTTVYDSLGNAHTLRQYFVKVAETDEGNVWNMITSLDGRFFPNNGDFNPGAFATDETWPELVDADGTVVGTINMDATDPAPGSNIRDYFQSSLFFNVSGGLVDARQWNGSYPDDPDDVVANPVAADRNPTFTLDLDGIIQGANFGIVGGATEDQIGFRLRGTTQYGATSTVQSQNQDGYATGRLAGLEVGPDGTIFGRYTNGQNRAIAQVPLATFNNPEGLRPNGSTAWLETAESGIPAINRAGAGTTGSLEGGALEESNVDLSEQLVKMIIAQRNFQANAKTIQTQDTLTQTIINLR